MAGYKKAKQKKVPSNRHVVQRKNADQFYSENPSWVFSNIDEESWAFSKEHVGDIIWTEILPKLQAFEQKTWADILVKDKKLNHAISAENLNKIAQKRLIERKIEADSIISLRLNGTHRIYGYMVEKVFNILWYDDDHGNNNRCVCRSYLKHT